MYDEERKFARCTREEYKGALEQNTDGSYSHLLSGDCKCGVTHQIAAAAQAPVAAGASAGGTGTARGRSQGTSDERKRPWPIFDFQGDLRAEHVRIERVGNPHDKRFEWWSNGRLGLNGVGSKDLLYGAELLRTAEPGTGVVLAEGEQAADALREAGYLALATVCGADSTPSLGVLARLIEGGRPVTLWPDNDEAGRQHMSRIAALLERAGAEPGQVRIVNWAEAPEKGDAADCSLGQRRLLLGGASPYRSGHLRGTDGTGGISLIERYGLGYRVLYDPGLELFLTRIKESSDSVSGELLVRWRQGPEDTRHIYQARLNLVSHQAKEGLPKILAKRTPDTGIEWDQVVERFCLDVLADLRRPKQRHRLGKLPRRNQEFMLWPLLHLGEPTIIYGAGGTGKSTIAAAVVVSVQTGCELVPGWRSMSAPVLVLDWESRPQSWNDRVDALAAGAGLDGVEFEYMRLARPLHEVVDQVAEVATDRGIGLLIVDSVGMASGAGHEHTDANSMAIQLFGALEEIGVTSLLIDHVTGEDRKSDKTVSKPYGSIFKENLARSTWELRREKDPADTAEILLTHIKVNEGRKFGQFGLALDYADDSIHIRHTELQAEELVSNLSTPERMERLLRDGAKSTPALAEALGVSPAIIRANASRHQNRFVRLPDQRIALRDLPR
jgi:hypothetical protein